MSTPPQETTLHREISELDLNEKLVSVQAQQGHGPRYTQDELLALRSETEKHSEHVEIAELNGVKTPPYLTCPAPPPPTPASPESSLTPTQNGHLDSAGANGALSPIAGAPPKKMEKSSGKTKKPAPTGFEEFYADPPITPDEHEEESELYATTRSFPHRIQTCIQRYRARRNLDSTRANILTKYFTLGGIDSTKKAFTGGLDKETLESATAGEIAAIQATDMVGTGSKNAKYYDPSDSENWVVDFEGVAKGFFAYRIPRMFSIDSEQDIKLYAAVIRNFLNYVLQHAVCPEYTQNVMAARKICDLAEKELWAIKRLQQKLPGDFNVAASTLYGGRYQGIHMSNSAWAADDPNFEDFVVLNQGFSDAQAERIFKTAIAFAGDDALFVEAMTPDIHIVSTETKSYEVVDIVRPDVKTAEEYSSVKNHKGEAGFIKALGVVHFKEWEGPGLDEDDVSDDEGAKQVPDLNGPTYSFWLEDEILQLCFVGLKLELVVHRLNIGILFFDTIVGIYPSFHTVLPNEKMIYWKEPVPNTRPPPTEDDPDVEERAMEAMMEGELEEDEKTFGEKQKSLDCIPEADAKTEQAPEA